MWLTAFWYTVALHSSTDVQHTAATPSSLLGSLLGAPTPPPQRCCSCLCPAGVANLAFTAFWVGRWPGTYHYFWLVKDLVLFTLRYLTYRQQGMHYM